MNRRTVAGVLALALVGSSQTSWGMQMRDPSAAGTVGMTPLDSIANKINDDTLPSGVVSPSGVPTDPTASGPRARVPRSPVGPNPVGMTPQASLNESVDQGYPTTGGFGRLFRRNPRPGTANANPKAARGTPASKFDPSTVPSRLNWDESGEPTSMSGATTTASGRPAPYANQTPELPRRQVNPPLIDKSEGDAASGRPAPLRSDVPRQARSKLTQGDGATAPKPRPRGAAGINPRTPPPVGPAPAIPSTLPAPEPIPPAAAPVELPPGGWPALEPSPARSPLPPQAQADSKEILPAMADAAPQPLPETPEPPPSVPTGPSVATVGPPPEVMSVEVSAVSSAPLPSSAAVAETAAIAPSPVLVATNLTPPPQPSTGPGRVDDEIRRTSDDSTALRIDKHRDKDRPFASARAAAVGDEVITVHQVETLVVEKYKAMTAGQQVSEEEKREILNTLGTMALERLIERSLVLQEANRRIKKNPKMQTQFDEFVNKRWHEEKLPPLLRKTATTNEYELKRKLAEEGQSYAEMQDNYHKDMLEHDFLFNEIKNKISVDLVQLRAYYNENIQTFNQPARINWREIEVSVAKYPDRAAARRQADAILARLHRKDDFAAVAQAVSDGPTASKGGLYADMTPGAYAIPSVNDVLNTIAEHEISPVLEAPMSFHIVRVESRRAAGPLPFDEVQKQVTETVFMRNMDKAREQYLAKLRAKTLVRVMPMFDPSKNGVNQAQRADGNVIPASNR